MDDIQARAGTEQEIRYRAVFCNLLLCWHHHVGKKGVSVDTLGPR
jgi:hypothetical protein